MQSGLFSQTDEGKIVADAWPLPVRLLLICLSPFLPQGALRAKEMIQENILPHISSSTIFFFSSSLRSKLLICSWLSSVVVHLSFNQTSNLGLCRAFGHKWLWSTKITLWALRWSSKKWPTGSERRADICNKQSSVVWTSMIKRLELIGWIWAGINSVSSGFRLRLLEQITDYFQQSAAIHLKKT